jgi:hypothetical protein
MDEHSVAGALSYRITRFDHDRRGVAVVDIPFPDLIEQAPIEGQELQFFRRRSVTRWRR